jgi:hypothetical protein
LIESFCIILEDIITCSYGTSTSNHIIELIPQKWGQGPKTRVAVLKIKGIIKIVYVGNSQKNSLDATWHQRKELTMENSEIVVSESNQVRQSVKRPVKNLVKGQKAAAEASTKIAIPQKMTNL